MPRRKLDLTDDATTVESSLLAMAQRRVAELEATLARVLAVIDEGLNDPNDEGAIYTALEALDAQSREAVKP